MDSDSFALAAAIVYSTISDATSDLNPKSNQIGDGVSTQTAISNQNVKWFLDSGTTEHMCSEYSYIGKFRPLTKIISLGGLAKFSYAHRLSSK